MTKVSLTNLSNSTSNRTQNDIIAASIQMRQYNVKNQNEFRKNASATHEIA